MVGLGGTLRQPSTSLWALQRALQGAKSAGATVEILPLHMLALPVFAPDRPLESFGDGAAQLIAAARRADAMLWSTAAYHNTIAGATKNALDYLEFLSDDTPPYLEGRFVGLVAVSGGDTAAMNAVNAMQHAAQALRALALTHVVPIPRARRLFSQNGELRDGKWDRRLFRLGEMVVEAVERYRPTKQPRLRGAESRPVYPQFEADPNDRRDQAGARYGT